MKTKIDVTSDDEIHLEKKNLFLRRKHSLKKKNSTQNWVQNTQF